MFEFLKEQRIKGNLTNAMLDLYKGIFINQEQYDKLKTIKASAS
jgi:hypothetical protein